MQTPTQIANDALSQIGADIVSSISDTNDPNAVLCNQYYDICWEEVLREFPWKEALKREELEGDETDTGEGKDYEFLLPDALVQVIYIHDADNNDLTADFDQRGQFLYGDTETIYMTYISSYGFTVDTYTYENPFIPSYIQHLVSLLIASKIVFRITQNEAMQSTLYQEYKIELDQAMVKNNARRANKGETYWSEVGK